MSFNFDDMVRFGTEAWGPLGTNAAHKWRDFNDRYFASELRPVPIVITSTQPFGRRLAFCSHSDSNQVDRPHGRTITLNVPSQHDFLVADNADLLHEMVHQYLIERGEPAKHETAGWRREIMRINKLLTGEDIWAGRYKTARQDGKVIRINEPHPVTGKPSRRCRSLAGPMRLISASSGLDGLDQKRCEATLALFETGGKFPISALIATHSNQTG